MSNFCDKCGSKVENGGKFCSVCGNQLNSGELGNQVKKNNLGYGKCLGLIILCAFIIFMVFTMIDIMFNINLRVIKIALPMLMAMFSPIIALIICENKNK